MSKYYAVVRSNNELAHYGVQGMKWGVRKAIERGSERRLSRHFAKAQKKLAKLERNANIKAQANIAQNELKKQRVSRRLGEAGIALGGAHAYGSIRSALQRAAKSPTRHAVANLAPALTLAAAGVGSLVEKSYHKHKKHQAERRMTTEGHAKAVAERDAFRREMNEAFKGTKYGKGGSKVKSTATQSNNSSANDYRNARRAGYIAGAAAATAYAKRNSKTVSRNASRSYGSTTGVNRSSSYGKPRNLAPAKLTIPNRPSSSYFNSSQKTSQPPIVRKRKNRVIRSSSARVR